MSKARSKIDLNRPEMDKPPEMDVQFQVVIIFRSIVGPELDMKMGCPHSEPLPEDEVVVGLTYPNNLRIQMT